MALTLDGLTRPRQTTTTALSPTLVVGTVVEDSTTEESFFIPVNIPNQDPPSFTVTNCTTTTGSPTLTTTNSFSDVRVGDPVSGTGIPVSTTVTAIASDNLSLTMSANATGSATIIATFNPGNIAAATMYALKINHVKSGSICNLQITLYTYDGSLAGTLGTAANASASYSLQPITGTMPAIDFDAFLTALRIGRSP